MITRMVRGGAAKTALELARRVSDEGHAVAFASGMDNTGQNSYWPELRETNFPGKQLRWLKRQPGWWDLPALFELAQLFNQTNPDCLHLHTSKAGTLGALAARISGTSPVIYSSHGHLFNPNLKLQDVSTEGVSRHVYYGLRKLTIDLSDRVVALSEHDRDEQVKLGLARREKFTVIPNGISTENFRELEESEQSRLRRELGADDFDPLLINVGRLVEEKGQETLLRAVAELADVYPDVGCLIVGEGPYRSSLVNRVEELDVQDRVIFTGVRNDVQDLLQLADAFCFPSLYESQGVAVMEAMAAGTPVVSTETGGLGELIEHERTALSIDPDSPETLADSVRRLLESPELRTSLTAESRKRIEENYSVDNLIRRTLELYRELTPDAS